MKYMGSKLKIAKEILPIILKNRSADQFYVEPFVGGCNIIDKVGGNRLASDNNRWLIAMWKGLQNGIMPPIITRELYNEARLQYRGLSTETLSTFEIGYIGWMGSFNGRFFDGGYSGQTSKRDYIDEQIRNTKSQLVNLKNVLFVTSDYSDLVLPEASIIYCDPPYKGTKQYSTSANFCHFTFWQRCRDWVSDGHTVFISEYNAPEDFKCVWQKQITNSMNTNITYKPIEKLFTLTP